jgi:tripartite ATP-independent transporter DctP family solute receptor
MRIQSNMSNAVSRRRFALAAGSVAAAFATVGVLRRPAGAAEFTYKLGLDFNDTHPSSIRLKEMAANVRRDSGGQLDVQVFPNSALGGDTAMLSQVRSGALQCYLAPGGVLATVAPPTSITYVNYAFNGYGQVWAAMDGDLGAFCRAAIERVGLTVFPAIWNNGFNDVATGVRPIQTPDDFRGLKIRTSASPIFVSAFKSLGAEPTAINLSEAYTALQTHVVDGVTDPLVAFDSERFYEVQKYLSLTNQMWGGFWFTMNTDAWKALPKKLQDILAHRADESARLQRADVDKLEKSLPAKLQAGGMIVNAPKPEPFRQKLRDAGFYSQWRAAFAPEGWKALEKYTGPLPS